jgi:hypothetical protein
VRTRFGEVGANIVQGIWEGIQIAWPLLTMNLPKFLANLLTASQQQIGAQSPSKVWAENIGLPMAQGIGVGFSQGMSTLGFQSELQPAGITASASAVRPATAERNITVGPITINGDLSRSAKQRLREEMHGMFSDTLVEALS